MKKKLNAEAPALVAEDAKAPRRHGPLKEKVQITVRLDQALMQQAYTQMSETNTRLTDLLEHGLGLALKELKWDLPQATVKARFLVNNTTKAQQMHLLRFLGFLVMDEVCELSPLEAIFRRSVLEYFESLESRENLLPNCFKLYQRYAQVAPEVQHPTGS